MFILIGGFLARSLRRRGRGGKCGSVNISGTGGEGVVVAAAGRAAAAAAGGDSVGLADIVPSASGMGGREEGGDAAVVGECLDARE